MDLQSDWMNLKTDWMDLKSNWLDLKSDWLDLKSDWMDLKLDWMSLKFAADHLGFRFIPVAPCLTPRLHFRHPETKTLGYQEEVKTPFRFVFSLCRIIGS